MRSLAFSCSPALASAALIALTLVACTEKPGARGAIAPEPARPADPSPAAPVASSAAGPAAPKGDKAEKKPEGKEEIAMTPEWALSVVYADKEKKAFEVGAEQELVQMRKSAWRCWYTTAQRERTSGGLLVDTRHLRCTDGATKLAIPVTCEVGTEPDNDMAGLTLEEKSGAAHTIRLSCKNFK